MKLLLLDKLQRLKWGWIFVSVFSLIIGLWLPHLINDLGTRTANYSFVLVMFSATWLLELGVGYGRVALSLPFKARDVGRLLWVVTVVVQTLVFACFSGLGILLGATGSLHHEGLLLL
jgi:hypothetical protein